MTILLAMSGLCDKEAACCGQLRHRQRVKLSKQTQAFKTDSTQAGEQAAKQAHELTSKQANKLRTHLTTGKQILSLSLALSVYLLALSASAAV